MWIFIFKNVKSTPPLTGLQNEGFHVHSSVGALTKTLQTTTTITTDAPVQPGGGDFTAVREHHNLTHYVHFARSKVGLGSQSLVCNTLVQHDHPYFIVFLFWPLIMISRTWERSIILVSISMMSGCSLAPLMNSSSVNSPCDTSREKHIKISLEKQNPQQRKCWGRTKTLYLLHWHLSCHI